jgi:hypothetical protein
MGTTYAISMTTGLATKVASHKGTLEKVRWNEEHLEALLTLNLGLVGVHDHLPLGLEGGTTRTGPDLIFIDEMGRLTIVEIKCKTAGVSALAQLLGYSDHWSYFPRAEANHLVRGYTKKGGAEGQVRRAAELVASIGQLSDAAKGEMIDSAVEAVVPGLFWADAQANDLAAFAKKRWSKRALSLLGIPSRKILIAPAFDDACVELAEAFAEHEVNLHLVRANIVRTTGKGGGLALDLEPVQEPERHEQCWTVASDVWKTSTVHETYELHVGASTKEGMVLASKKSPDARIWIGATKEGVDITTRVPHGWYSNSPKRKSITSDLLGALDGALPEHDGHGDHFRVFKPGTKPAAITKCITCVAAALDKTVVPHAP